MVKGGWVVINLPYLFKIFIAVEIMTSPITLSSTSFTIKDCESVILVPTIAVTEPGYIKALTIKGTAHAKHEFHAMAQMAYFQFQDEELESIETDTLLTVTSETEHVKMSDGMVLYRTLAGEFCVIFHAGEKKKTLLEAAYRYCTRWVRLDI